MGVKINCIQFQQSVYENENKINIIELAIFEKSNLDI